MPRLRALAQLRAHPLFKNDKLMNFKFTISSPKHVEHTLPDRLSRILETDPDGPENSRSTWSYSRRLNAAIGDTQAGEWRIISQLSLLKTLHESGVRIACTAAA